MKSGVLTAPALGIITNPHSRKNRRRPGRARALQDRVGELGLVRATRSLEDIDAVVREFHELGIRYWIADGGDGCLHWMLNKAAEVLGEDGVDAIPELVPYALPATSGTIDFVARCAGLNGRFEDVLDQLARARRFEQEGRIAAMPSVELPSMRASGLIVDKDGGERRFERLVFSAAIAGCGSRIFDELYSYDDRGSLRIARTLARHVITAGGRLVKLDGLMPERWGAALDEVMRPHILEIEVDGQVLPYERYGTVNASALSINLGHVLRLFPLANGEQLHVIAGEARARDVARNMPRLMSGRPLKSDKLYDGPGRRMVVRAIGDELLRPVIDGEMLDRVRVLELELGPRIRFARPDLVA